MAKDTLKTNALVDVLSQEERILDSMLEEQNRVHNSVVSRSWEGLEKTVGVINELGTRFSKTDLRREQIADISDDVYFDRDVRDVFLRVKQKLSKSKIENDALAKYVAATKSFISAVMDDCASQQNNNVYSYDGSMKRSGYATQSIVVNKSI